MEEQALAFLSDLQNLLQTIDLWTLTPKAKDCLHQLLLQSLLIPSHFELLLEDSLI